MINDNFLSFGTTDVSGTAGPTAVFGTLVPILQPRDMSHGELYAHFRVTGAITGGTDFRVTVYMDDNTGGQGIPLGTAMFGSVPLTTQIGSYNIASLSVPGFNFFIPLMPLQEGLTQVTPGVRVDAALSANTSFLRVIYHRIAGTIAGGAAIAGTVGLKPTVIGRTYPVGTNTYF